MSFLFPDGPSFPLLSVPFRALAPEPFVPRPKRSREKSSPLCSALFLFFLLRSPLSSSPCIIPRKADGSQTSSLDILPGFRVDEGKRRKKTPSVGEEEGLIRVVFFLGTRGFCCRFWYDRAWVSRFIPGGGRMRWVSRSFS